MLGGREAWAARELAHAGRENLDPAHLARCDQKEDGDATGELAALWAFGVDEHATVSDLGAGTGQFALAAAAAVRRVVADVSPVMLEHLRSELRRRGVQKGARCEKSLSYAVNTRATLLLVKACAAQHDGLPGGRRALHLRPVPRRHAIRAATTNSRA